MAKTPKPVDVYVGSRLRMRRAILDMSQTNIGDALGLSFQQGQKYERGTNRISASRLQKIAHILQVPVQFFFEGSPGQLTIDGQADSATFVVKFFAMSDGLALVNAFTRITDTKLKRRIVALVEEIAGAD
jgi:transcriptional regulator with XRE-family HTH domain